MNALRFVVVMLVSSSFVYACQFLIVNDSLHKIIVIDLEEQQMPFEIIPGQQKIAGDAARHVHYKLLQKRGNEWIPVYEFEMVSCANPGDQPRVVLSELAHGTIADTFSLTRLNSGYINKPAEAPKTTGCCKCKEKAQQA